MGEERKICWKCHEELEEWEIEEYGDWCDECVDEATGNQLRERRHPDDKDRRGR